MSPLSSRVMTLGNDDSVLQRGSRDEWVFYLHQTVVQMARQRAQDPLEGFRVLHGSLRGRGFTLPSYPQHDKRRGTQ